MSPMRNLTWCMVSALFTAVVGCQTLNGNYDLMTQNPPAANSELSQVNYEEDVAAGTGKEEADQSWVSSALSTKGLGNGISRLRGTHKDEQEAKKLYNLATEKFDEAAAAQKQAQDEPDKPAKLSAAQRRALFASAAEIYKVAAIRWTESALGEDALFMAGESNFFADRYVDASFNFAELVKQYPNSRHMDRVDGRRFAMAQYWLGMVESGNGIWTVNLTDPRRPTRDEFTNAVKLFLAIRLDNPGGKLADDATLASANAYFRAKKFVRADEDYSYLRKTYPSSEHQFIAHFFAAKAKYESYLGPEYDAAVLENSAELIQRCFQIFPEDARDHEEELKKLLAKVRFKQAEKEWSRGQFHEGRGEIQGARYYYNNIVKDYPQTPFAERAQAKLDSLADVTTIGQRFSWLNDLLDQGNDDPPLIAAEPESDETRR
jgi:outer membrane protein assembly factor BamD (BamD/ComL family)